MATFKELAKAEAVGREDAETWLSETDSELWDDAIKPGVLGADEALCNALGVAKALEFLGCEDSEKQGEYFHAYSVAWANRVAEEIAERDAK